MGMATEHGRRTWRPSVLLALLCGAALHAGAVPDTTLTHGPWKVTIGEWARFSVAGVEVTSLGPYTFKAEQAEPIDGGVRLSGQLGDNRIVATYVLTDGKLVCRYAASGGANPLSYFTMLNLSGGDLADTDVVMDGTAVRVPAKFDPSQQEFAPAREFLFFRHNPGKTVRLAFPQCGYANLRDFRGEGRTDFQVFTFPDSNGVIEAVVDLTAAVDLQSGEAYPGARFATQDDLHLPDQRLSRNLVQNPGFEGGLARWSLGVADLGRLAPDRVHGWALDPEQGRTGRKGARYSIVKGLAAPMLCSQPVAVNAGGTYTASFYARADRDGVGFSTFIHTAIWEQFPANSGMRVGLTTNWQRYTIGFTAPNAFAQLCFGDRWWEEGGADQVDGAQVWLDDVQLEAGAAVTDYVQKPVHAASATGTEDEVMALDAAAPRVTVTLVNCADEAATCAVDVAIQDIYRTTLLATNVACELPAWGERAVEIDAGDLGLRGLLRVVMAARRGEFAETFYGRVALLRELRAPGKVRYAYHLEDPSVAEVRRWQRYGVSGGLSFNVPVRPESPGELAREDWLQTITPADSRTAPVKMFHQAMTEADWQAFDDWLARRIAPYPQQTHWKTVNEPNCAGYTWTPAEHVRVVDIIRKHVRAINPDARILTPDPYNAGRNGQAWLEAFFQAGGDKLVDVLAIHPYRARPEAPDLDQDIQALIALKAAHGLGEAPIFFTEGEATPIYAIGEIGMSPFTGWYEWRLRLLGLDVGRSELAAAGLMTRTLLACLKNSAHVKFYLAWIEDVHRGQPAASLGALNFLFDELGQGTFQREHVIGNDTKTYVFTTAAGEAVAVMWSYDLKIDRGEAPPVEARIPLPEGGLRVRDMMGNALAYRTEGGMAVIELGGHPRYVSGPGLTVEALNGLLERAVIGGQGVRSVDMTLRMTGRGAAEFRLANRLVRPVAGQLAIRAGDGETAHPIVLNGKATWTTPLALPESGGPFHATPVAGVFAESGGAGETRRTQEFRWFAIAPLPRAVAVDGDDADWEGVPVLALEGDRDLVGFEDPGAWRGAADLSAACRVGYREDGLYLCVRVRDDAFNQGHGIDRAWMGDSLQLYFDLLADGRDRPGLGYGSGDATITVAKAGGRDQLYRDYAPEWQIGFVKAGPLASGDCVIRRDGDETVYELRLPAKEVFPLKMQAGTTFGFGLLVNDADADGRRRQGLSNTGAGTQPHGEPERWPAAVLVAE